MQIEQRPQSAAAPSLHIPLWLVWAVALGFVLTALGSYGILDNNEGLYAEIPREMLASHDWKQWIIPHLNGLPYMEKPPLLYWLTALSFSLFGMSEWAARLVPALSSLVCAALILRFGQAVQRPHAGRLAALMFASSLGVAVMSRTLMFDMLLTACLTGALSYAYRYGKERQARMLRAAYLWLALALMAKGFVALILFGLVMAPAQWSRVHEEGLAAVCKAWLEPGAVALFFLVAAPWHIAASLVEPIFPWFYFINEHVLRFLGKREPHDYYAGGWWYYLPRMILFLFPWSFLLPSLAGRAQTKEEGDLRPSLSRFLLLAWLMPLIFFSISSAKANYYLVTVMPFAAFHLALALERRDFLQGAALRRLLPGALLALIGAVLLAVAARRADSLPADPLIAGYAPAQFTLAVLAGLSLLALLCALAAWRWRRVGIVGYVLLSAWCMTALATAIGPVEALVSTRPLVRYLQTDLPGRKVYLYRNFEQQSSLPFYLQQPVSVIDSLSADLYWGNKLQANSLLISSEQFAQALATEKVAVVVLPKQAKDFEAASFFVQIKGRHQIGAAAIYFN